MSSITPGKAIRKTCLNCVEKTTDIRNCGGDECLGNQGDKNGACYFYSYRLGKGRPSVKLIRRFCLECMGGSSILVKECQTTKCYLYQYRFGKNPKRAGQRPKFLPNPDVSG